MAITRLNRRLDRVEAAITGSNGCRSIRHNDCSRQRALCPEQLIALEAKFFGRPALATLAEVLTPVEHLALQVQLGFR